MKQRHAIVTSFSDWLRRNLSHPDAITLFISIAFTLIFLHFFGDFFIPVLVSIVLAYLLMAPVRLFARVMPHLLAVIMVYCLFLAAVIVLVLFILPVVWDQSVNFVSVLPQAFLDVKLALTQGLKKYPRFIDQNQIALMLTYLQNHLTDLAQYALKYLVTSIPNIFEVVIYIILVPLLLFFFLKDSKPIIAWFHDYMPRNRSVMQKVLQLSHQQVGAYIRGKVIEILIVSTVSVVAFMILGLPYPVLLGVLIGLSVLIPYVGAILVTIPVVVIGLMEWGLTSHFAVLMIVYGIIVALDANLLVPLLFAETMKLHPVVIVLAVIVFGSVWGFWGLFFAIPLASFINIVLQAWPQHDHKVAEN